MPSRPPPRPVHRAIRSVCRSRTVTPASFITSATPIPSSPRSRNRLAATLTIRSCVVCLSLFEFPISIQQLYYKRNLPFGRLSGFRRFNSALWEIFMALAESHSPPYRRRLPRKKHYRNSFFPQLVEYDRNLNTSRRTRIAGRDKGDPK